MVTVKIQTTNAAFKVEDAFDDDALHTETARILRVAADRIAEGETFGNLWDMNGNRVGRFWVF